MTMGKAGKELDSGFGRLSAIISAFSQEQVALIPNLFRNQGFNLSKYPVLLGL